MTRVTDKLSDKQLIDLANQQYDAKQKERRIATEVIDLISQGKVYPEGHRLRSGTIEMRYMTAYDEDILMTQSYIEKGIAINKLIEALIVSPVSFDEIAGIDVNGLIVAARILSYGKIYEVSVKSPTDEIIQDQIDLSQLEIKHLTIDSDENGEFDYIINDSNKIKFKFPKTNNLSEKRSEFLQHIIQEVNGNRDANYIAEWIRYDFTAIDSRKFVNYFVDNIPQVVTKSEFEYTTAEGKKETFEAGFQLGSDLFWF
jgi:hypothetical protein